MLILAKILIMIKMVIVIFMVMLITMIMLMMMFMFVLRLLCSSSIINFFYFLLCILVRTDALFLVMQGSGSQGQPIEAAGEGGQDRLHQDA